MRGAQILAKLSRSALTHEQAVRELELIAFTSDLETIGDVVDIDLTHCRTLRIRSSYELASRHRANYHYCAFADGMLIHRQRNLAATLLQRANPQLPPESTRQRLRHGYRDTEALRQNHNLLPGLVVQGDAIALAPLLLLVFGFPRVEDSL